jgi:hypothetical protein
VALDKYFSLVEVCCQSADSWLCVWFFIDVFYFLPFSVVLEQISYVMVVECAPHLIKCQTVAGDMWV